jgi:hypothetical protein
LPMRPPAKKGNDEQGRDARAGDDRRHPCQASALP